METERPRFHVGEYVVLNRPYRSLPAGSLALSSRSISPAPLLSGLFWTVAPRWPHSRGPSCLSQCARPPQARLSGAPGRPCDEPGPLCCAHARMGVMLELVRGRRGCSGIDQRDRGASVGRGQATASGAAASSYTTVPRRQQRRLPGVRRAWVSSCATSWAM
jgi:hypothetical protein